MSTFTSNFAPASRRCSNGGPRWDTPCATCGTRWPVSTGSAHRITRTKGPNTGERRRVAQRPHEWTRKDAPATSAVPHNVIVSACTARDG